MSLKVEDVKKIVHLARLSVAEDGIAPLNKDLDRILDLVEQMNSVNTDAIKPMAHPLDEKQSMRQDQVTEIDQRELFQSIAPETQAGLYIVPQVIETE